MQAVIFALALYFSIMRLKLVFLFAVLMTIAAIVSLIIGNYRIAKQTAAMTVIATLIAAYRYVRLHRGRLPR
jgi:hypothetical protein